MRTVGKKQNFCLFDLSWVGTFHHNDSNFWLLCTYPQNDHDSAVHIHFGVVSEICLTCKYQPTDNDDPLCLYDLIKAQKTLLYFCLYF